MGPVTASQILHMSRGEHVPLSSFLPERLDDVGHSDSLGYVRIS